MNQAFTPDAKVFVAGHRGLVGSAILRALQAQGFTNLLLATSAELDLRSTVEVQTFFARQRPDFVFLAAAKVGGILANSTYPADFIRDNLLIQTNVIDSAYREGTTKLLFLGSSCIYPRDCPQPIKEEYLLTGPLEESNEWYAIAKIAGIKMCQAYRRQYGFNAISAMPTNLYGPNDNFDLQTSHVLPALVRKVVEAKARNEPSVTLWGSGTPRREFLHVDDCADACLFLMNNYEGESHINVGSGVDVTILELAEIVRDAVGFTGEFQLDRTKPDGTMRKLMSSARLHALGWRHRISLAEGIAGMVTDYRLNLSSASEPVC